MRALLIGAGGFLGRHIRQVLETAGVTVQLPPSGDLNRCASAELQALVSSVDAVVNAAGRTAGSLPDLVQANVLLPARLVEAAAASGVRLVHLGSAAEYGAGTGAPVRESDPCQPLGSYGISKLAGTQLVVQAVATGQLRGTVLRVFNPLGAGMPAGTLPGRAVQQLQQARSHPQAELHFGPLGQRRDFLDARDVGRAVLHVLHTESPALLNVGLGETLSGRELVAALVELSGFRGRIVEDGDGSLRSGGVPFQQADVQLLRASGFAPAHTVHDALTALWSEAAPASALPA
ncbi:NAD(P)-dependent oxidoreductase [Deinococcus sonorensis]|uniref:NAD(P)-dependent oxidoreductase n=2 Tax=Deinococcus sonorensis TaxID=309891 RepID=A0AAU7UB82_9DEIO